MTLSILSKSQTITQTTTAATIGTIVPGYSQVSTYNTKTISYTPSTPDIPTTPVDDDTTTEDIKKWDYANPLSVNINMNDGNTTNTSAGKVWTLRISIPNALNIGVTFQQFDLSATAEMYIFNEARTVVKGSLKKNYFSNTVGITTAPMKGNSIIIYIVEPNNTGALQSIIAIQKVMAGYQNIDEVGSTGSILKAEGASVNCDPLIICSPDKLSTARTVAKFYPGNGFQCSGTLLNTEANNGRAFFLTAFHCLDINPGLFGGHPGNNVLDADEIVALQNSVFQFQFWRSECNGTVNNSFIEFSGAALRGNAFGSDAVLLELLNPPGIGDGVNYAGWSRVTTEPSDNSSFIIHHPQGQDMRLTKTRDVKSFGGNGNFWSAHYSSGTVDKGSSGSALFNENKQVVGQLRSGWSNCNYTDYGDRYGKFSESWTFAGLQPWLSPNQNLQSIYSLDLFPLTIQGPSGIYCGGNVQFSVPGGLLGCTYFWTVGTNLQIVSGQGTGTVTVKGVQTTNISSSVQVQITDTKGRNRTATAVKNLSLSVSKPFIGGTYTNNASEYPLAIFNGSGPYNNACTQNMVYTKMQLTGASSITWSKISSSTVVNWTQQLNDINFYLFSINSTAVFQASASNGCGTTSYQFAWKDVDCGGTTCGANYVVSPNPAINNINIVPDIPLPCKGSLENFQILEVRIYDPQGNLKIDEKYPPLNMQAQINISTLKTGLYMMNIFNGKVYVKKPLVVGK